MKIGFIGLGNMGAPMAANLVAAGYDLLGHDLSDIKLDHVSMADSAAAVVGECEVVVTMLPDGRALLDVYKQIIPAARVGSCLLDCSTVDISASRKAHKMAAGANLLSLDAPVSGGVVGAKAGTLTFMVGGTDAAFAKGEKLFDVMGQHTVRCGAGGTGQAAKICNNMILGISMIGVCEAFNLADHMALDRAVVFEVVSSSSGSCWSMNSYCPTPDIGPQSPADNDYQPGFAAELMLKDLNLAQEAANLSGAATPMGALAARLYEQFVEDGGKGRDFSAMLPYLAKLAREGKSR